MEPKIPFLVLCTLGSTKYSNGDQHLIDWSRNVLLTLPMYDSKSGRALNMPHHDTFWNSWSFLLPRSTSSGFRPCIQSTSSIQKRLNNVIMLAGRGWGVEVESCCEYY